MRRRNAWVDNLVKLPQRVTDAWVHSGLRRNLSLSIVILVLGGFQVVGSAWSADNITIFKDGAVSEAQYESIVQMLKRGGYTFSVLDEADLYRMNVSRGDVMIYPLGRRISGSEHDALVQFLRVGGQLFLLSGRNATDRSVADLLATLGAPVSGVQFAARNLPLHWRQTDLNDADSSERLNAGAPVMIFENPGGMDVLAGFSRQHPALVKTRYGAVMNWGVDDPDMRENTAKAFSIILGAPNEPTSTVSENSASAMPVQQPLPPVVAQPTLELKPLHTPSPQAAVSTTPQLSAPEFKTPVGMEDAADVPADTSAPEIAVATAIEPIHPVDPSPAEPEFKTPIGMESSAEAHSQVAEPALIEATPTQPVAIESIPDAPPQTAPAESPDIIADASVAPAEPAAPRNLNKSLTDADNENVFSDIPETDKSAEGENDAFGEAFGDDEPRVERQKTVSFIGGGSGYNDFDYGEYYQKTQALHTLRQRVEEGLTLASLFKTELAMPQINDLLIAASRDKSKFEAEFLAGHAPEATQAFQAAQTELVQAIGMTNPSPKVEGRAIWLDRGSIVASGSPEGLKRHLQKLHDAGINIIYFETLNAGFPVYPSKILPHNPLISGWDPLKVAVAEGHRLGMEVHAWVWCFAVGNMRHNPLIEKPASYPGPILEDAGLMAEALRNASGGLTVDARQHEYWLSPASPRARQTLISIYSEIVSGYDVDGLQLDYIRYPFQSYRTQMGFEPQGRQRFQASTGLSLDSLDDKTRKMWIAWKTYQINSFVKEVSGTLKGIKPDLKLSAAVFPITRANRILAIQQDWETWIENGWIDTLSPMSYTSSPKRLQKIFDYVANATPKHAIVYPGIAINKLDSVQLVMQLEALRDVGSLGNTMFAMAHLNDEKAKVLGDGPYKIVPPSPPHHDPLGGLELVLSDYHQKFTTLSQFTDQPLPDEPSKLIRRDLDELHGGLAMLRQQVHSGPLSVALLESARTNLAALKASTDLWEAQESPEQAFRSRYFGRLVLMMQQMLDYLSDQPSLYQADPRALREESPAG